MVKGLTFRDGLAALVFFGLLAYAAQAEYFGLELLAEIAIFAVLAMSLDLLAGVTGLVSLGHAAFFGLGAYPFKAGQTGAVVEIGSTHHDHRRFPVRPRSCLSSVDRATSECCLRKQV